jgi:hypothetical protein
MGAEERTLSQAGAYLDAAQGQWMLRTKGTPLSDQSHNEIWVLRFLGAAPDLPLQ